MTNEDTSVNFWRMYHSLTRHSHSEQENDRCKQVAGWLMENTTQVRKVCIYMELDIMGTIFEFVRDQSDLPSSKMVEDLIQQRDKSEGIMEEFVAYEDILGSQDLGLFGPADMSRVLEDKTTDFEKAKVELAAKMMTRIVNGSAPEDKKTKKKLEGPKDAVNWFMNQLEEGIIVPREGTNHPIVVQNEADEIGRDYDKMLKLGHYTTGIPELPVYNSDFFGILGYKGGGKSTISRFMAYNMAMQGKSILHISLENDATVERNKYVLLHAHNPIFNGEFATLSYRGFKQGTLNKQQRGWLDYIAKDFRDRVSGRMVLRQPQTASWEHVKAITEMQENSHPVDVLLIDYLQLLEPAAGRADDVRTRMGRMVKDVRQFGLTFRSSNKLVIISPIQSNEEGLKKALENDFVWSLSAVNNDKELSASMNTMCGVCDQGVTKGTSRSFVLSSVKDRDGIGFMPHTYSLSCCGWISDDTRTERIMPDMVDL